jgi:hypothetical protein
MKVLYYIIWILCIAFATVAMATLSGTLLGFDSVGTKGLTAGIGIFVLYYRKSLFALLDNLFNKKI